MGTKDYAAHVRHHNIALHFFNSICLQLYDLTSGQLVQTFQDENLSNRYVKNRATFHPTDDLILNDGVLWDVRSRSPVHKFDKFNQHINGVFHPNGQEILANSEIVSLVLQIFSS